MPNAVKVFPFLGEQFPNSNLFIDNFGLKAVVTPRGAMLVRKMEKEAVIGMEMFLKRHRKNSKIESEHASKSDTEPPLIAEVTSNRQMSLLDAAETVWKYAASNGGNMKNTSSNFHTTDPERTPQAGDLLLDLDVSSVLLKQYENLKPPCSLIFMRYDKDNKLQLKRVDYIDSAPKDDLAVAVVQTDLPLAVEEKLDGNSVKADTDSNHKDDSTAREPSVTDPWQKHDRSQLTPSRTVAYGMQSLRVVGGASSANGKSSSSNGGEFFISNTNSSTYTNSFNSAPLSESPAASEGVGSGWSLLEAFPGFDTDILLADSTVGFDEEESGENSSAEDFKDIEESTSSNSTEISKTNKNESSESEEEKAIAKLTPDEKQNYKNLIARTGYIAVVRHSARLFGLLDERNLLSFEKVEKSDQTNNNNIKSDNEKRYTSSTYSSEALVNDLMGSRRSLRERKRRELERIKNMVTTEQNSTSANSTATDKTPLVLSALTSSGEIENFDPQHAAVDAVLSLIGDGKVVASESEGEIVQEKNSKRDYYSSRASSLIEARRKLMRGDIQNNGKTIPIVQSIRQSMLQVRSKKGLTDTEKKILGFSALGGGGVLMMAGAGIAAVRLGTALFYYYWII